VSSSDPAISSGSTDPEVLPPYARQALDVVATLGSDPASGLTAAEAGSRLAHYGPNRIAGEKPPSIIVVALSQLRDP